MKNKIIVAIAILLVSGCADAGVLTYMAASDAAASASRTETAVKSKSVSIKTGPNSVMCDYDNGSCHVNDRTHASRLQKWYNLPYLWGVKCTPEQFVSVVTGQQIVNGKSVNKITSITYVYFGSVKAVIEYE